jgi:hypothetical protein
MKCGTARCCCALESVTLCHTHIHSKTNSQKLTQRNSLDFTIQIPKNTLYQQSTSIAMNLAEPAPRVEAASAAIFKNEEPTTATMATPVEAATATTAPGVGPAVAYSDNREYAPSNVVNPDPVGPSAMSVDTLRGNGASFESYAAVLRGAPPKNCFKIWLPCFYDERDFISYGEVKKYALIKGTTCFIFKEHTDQSPLYAIPLGDVYTKVEDPNHPDKSSVTVSPSSSDNKSNKRHVTVLLMYKKDDGPAYQFTFDTKDDAGLAKRFVDVLAQASKEGKNDAVTASILHVDQVGKLAMVHQPEI